jgi:hypothetical protein
MPIAPPPMTSTRHSWIGRASAHRQVGRVPRSGCRLGERSAARRQILRHGDQRRRGDAHELGKGTGARHADHRAVGAQVVAALHAVVASAARDQRVAGEARADSKARHRRLGDAPDELVAEHEARLAAWVMAMPGVHVGAADADGFYLQHHFASSGLRHRPLLQLDFVGLRVDEGSHRCAISRCTRHRPSGSGR